MFRLSIVVLAIAAMASREAQSTDNVAVTVNATVVSVCKFISTSATLNIRNTSTGSNIDPSSSTTATRNVGIAYRCTNGTVPAFTVPSNVTLTCAACPGTPTMAATITSTNNGAGRGFGSGQNRQLTVTGSITQAVFQNAKAGAYRGTMTVTVAP